MLIKYRLLYHFPERGLKPLGATAGVEVKGFGSPLPLPREGIETNICLAYIEKKMVSLLYHFPERGLKLEQVIDTANYKNVSFTTSPRGD